MSRILTAFLLLFAAFISPTHAVEETWEGYIWKDREGNFRLGWPVIAMGVDSRGPHVFHKDMARQLEPLLSPVQDDYFFWNYSWIEDPRKHPPLDIARLPKALVRVRGEAGPLEKRPNDGKPPLPLLPGNDAKIMHQGRVISVEFLTDDWLKGWQALSRLGLRYGYLEGGTDEARIRETAPKALTVLREMRKHSAIGEAQRRRAAAIDPKTVPTRHFQAGIEAAVHRWLINVDSRVNLKLADLADLGDPPPTFQELQQWFLDAKDKQAFFDKVRSAWKGELGELSLWYYWSPKPGQTISARVRLDELNEKWTPDEYLERQRLTREVLKPSP